MSGEEIQGIILAIGLGLSFVLFGVVFVIMAWRSR